MNAVLKKIIPNIGTALEVAFPPFGGMAGALIANLTGTDKVTADNVDNVIAAAQAKDPEILLKLKQADHDFQLKMADLGIESSVQLEQIAATDRASARAREIAVHDNLPKILAIGVTLGFFGLLTFLILKPVPVESKEVLFTMTGVLGTAFTGIVTYYFGSSSGSARKTEIIQQQSK